MTALAAVLLLAAASPALAQTPASASSETPSKAQNEGALSVEAALAIALANNPGLQEIEQRVRAAEAVPSQVGALPDPMLNFTAMNLPADTFDRDQENMTQMKIGVSQAFPFPGKRRLRREAAAYEAEAAASTYEEARWMLIRDIQSEWWQAFYLDRALGIVARNLELLRGFVRIAGEKYAVGDGLQSDVVLAQLELSKLLDLEVRLKAARAASGARLAALLAYPPGADIRIRNDIDTALPELPGEDALMGMAEESSPRIAARMSRVDAAEAREDFARRDFYPDFTLSADYGFRKGIDQGRNVERADFVTFGFGIKIPLYAGAKQSKALEQRKAERSEQLLGLAQTRLAVQRDVETALVFYRQTREQVQLFGTGIIPQARQTVDAMRAAYMVGEVDFLNLVSAQITLYNYETRYWQVLSEAKQAVAAIEAAVGKDISHD